MWHNNGDGSAVCTIHRCTIVLFQFGDQNNKKKSPALINILPTSAAGTTTVHTQTHTQTSAI